VLLRSRQETTPLCRGKLSVPNRLFQLKFPIVKTLMLTIVRGERKVLALYSRVHSVC